MIIKDKVTENFGMVDEFCIFFDAKTVKYITNPSFKPYYHRDSTMLKGQTMILRHKLNKQEIQTSFI